MRNYLLYRIVEITLVLKRNDGNRIRNSISINYPTHSDPSHFLLDEHFSFLWKSVVNYENIVSETERHYGFATIS
jgi:hypothetical protein